MQRDNHVRSHGEDAVCRPRSEVSRGTCLDPAWISDSQPQPCLDLQLPASRLEEEHLPPAPFSLGRLDKAALDE